jgi:hypothetical protein
MTIFSTHMPISEPELKPSDIFHVVGFTAAEVKSGAISRSLEISEEGFKTVAALGKKGSPLWEAAQADHVSKRLIEVYFIETRGSRENVALAESYGREFQIIHFYNDTALEIIKAAGISIPAVVAAVSRADLPAKLGVGIRDFYFKVLPI